MNIEDLSPISDIVDDDPSKLLGVEVNVQNHGQNHEYLHWNLNNHCKIY